MAEKHSNIEAEEAETKYYSYIDQLMESQQHEQPLWTLLSQ